MTLLPILLAIALAGDKPACSMKALPIDIRAIKDSKEVRSYVLDTPQSASILLTNGNLIRVVNMGCVDSGGVAHIWVASPPNEKDYAQWRKLFIATAKVAFGSNSSESFASWVPQASFSKTDRFALNASISGDVDMWIDVQHTTDGIGDVVTMSFTHH